MKSIRQLIRQFGEDKAKEFLIRYYSKEENLKDFALLFPNHIDVKPPQYQEEIFDLVTKTQRLCLAAPRGSGKSTITDVIVLAWEILYCKSNFSVLISDTLTQSTLHLGSLASELTSNPFILWLFGDVVGETWGAEMLIVKTRFGESAVVAKGAGQKIRGLKWRQYRPQLVIIDDLENDELVESVERREKLANWFRFNLMRGLAKGAKVFYIGTVLHDRALLKRIIDRDSIFGTWEIRIYKAIKSDGSSFWEERFPIEYLIAMRDDPKHPEYAGSLVFAQEMQHEPRSEQDRIIQEGWIRYYNINEMGEAWLNSLTIVGGVDPAISEHDGSSEFVFKTLGLDKQGHWWELDTVRGKMSVDKQIEAILNGFARWNHDIIGVESIAYQKVLSQLLKIKGAERVPPVYPRIKELMTDKDKTRRMILHSSKFEGGFVHFDKSHPETSNTVEALIRFPSEPNDVPDAIMLTFETFQKKKGRVFANKPRGF